MKEIVASMAGNVWKVLVAVDEKIEVGQEVVILESMKMEIPIAAETAGVVAEIRAVEGSFVDDGEVLIVLK